MEINFMLGKVIGDPNDMDKIKANIEKYLLDPSQFTAPENGIVNVSIYSGDPPFFRLMGNVSNSAGKILLNFQSSLTDLTDIAYVPDEPTGGEGK